MSSGAGVLIRNLPSPDLAVLDYRPAGFIGSKVIEQSRGEKAMRDHRPRRAVLSPQPHRYLLRVSVRLARISSSGECSSASGDETEAIELVDTMDDERRKFVKHHLAEEWPNRALFQVDAQYRRGR